MNFEAIQRNDEAVVAVRLESEITEETNVKALRLGRALRNNTVVERIEICNYNEAEGNEELVSDVAQYLPDILYFLRHGPSLQSCRLEYLENAWESILQAVGANPMVRDIKAFGWDRPVDNLRLSYVVTLDLSFESPQPWITDALYTASNLRQLTIKVNDSNAGGLIRVFEHLTACPQLRSVSISKKITRPGLEDGAHEMLVWIARNCPLLDHLGLTGFVIDSEASPLIDVPSLGLHNCDVTYAPPAATIRHLQCTPHSGVSRELLARGPHVVVPRLTLSSSLLVQSQAPVLETFTWNNNWCSNIFSNRITMVSHVLPQVPLLRSLTIGFLDFDDLAALLRCLPQYRTLKHLTVRAVNETSNRTLDELSQILLQGLRGNSSLATVTLRRLLYADGLNHGAPPLFPSATHTAMNRFLERNEELPDVLQSVDVHSPLVPLLLFSALEAPATGICRVAQFVWRYN